MPNGTLTERFTINETGGSFAGNTYQNTSFIQSDKRFKKSIRPIDNPLALLHRLNGVSYEMRTKEFAARSFSADRQLGLIAQDIENVFPELVTTQKDGYKAVNYDGLIPVLIEGMKAQQSTILALEEKAQTTEQLQEKVANQQTQIDDLTSLVEALIATKSEGQNTNNYVLPLNQKAYIEQNRPNPFRNQTLIDYYIPANVQKAQLRVHTLEGKELGLVQITQMGKGQVTVQTDSYPAGKYFYSLVLDGQVFETKQMVLMR